MQTEIINSKILTIIAETIKILLLTYYCNFKLINKKISFKLKTNIIIVILGVIVGTIRYKVSYFVSTLILIIGIGIIFPYKNFGNNLLTTAISLSINYAIELFSIVICFAIEKIIGTYNDCIELGIITITHIMLIYSIFRIKKFKYGITFLQRNNSDEYIDLLIFNISIMILFAVVLISNSDLKVTKILFIEIIISAIIMFITIKKSLNLYYKQKLLVQELNETKEELAKKKEEIKELEEENLTFQKKSHSLIHQQKALEYKIQQILMQTEISAEQVGEVEDKLNKIGKEIYKEKENIELAKTGITEIDDMLKYMQSECNKNKIEFILQLKGNIHQMINNAVSKDDLEILLADHIKNAIIAIKHSNNINRTIMVKLGKMDTVYGISIYDSGIEFEQETLNNLGKKPSTTHAEDGGTGMGFMNTFETLGKYKASLEIEEYSKPSKDNYTKVIHIKFNQKNEFKIKSYRR